MQKILKICQKEEHQALLTKQQLMNSRVPEIAIYLHTYLHVPFHHIGIFSIHPLVLHEQTWCIAVTKLIWTAVILNANVSLGDI